MARTLNEIELELGFTAHSVAAEYLAGDYGDISAWIPGAIAEAEMEGDTGDQLERDDALVFAEAVDQAVREHRAT